jgi:hypothetical protein
MPRRIPQITVTTLLEALAEIEHERWSHWQRYMHSKCEHKRDGSLVIPFELVSQWERQITAPYQDLSESEKNSDRDQVRRYLPTILKALDIVVDEE